MLLLKDKVKKKPNKMSVMRPALILVSHVSVVFLALLAACATRGDEAIALAQGAGWKWETMSAKTFDLAAAIAPERQGKTLWVYIEGDGRAFLSPTQPSSDPTPDDPVALRLALAYPHDTPTAYLAHPCQYAAHGRNCKAAYWTNARYAPEVVASLNEAVDDLKAQTKTSRVVLVGYSGGGALAVLIAARRQDVAEIITVAADLDLAYWTKRDGLTPLTDSLDPADFAAAVAKIPQVHFSGALDTSIGTDVANAFISRLPSDAPAKLIEIPGYTHTCCWPENWARLDILASPNPWSTKPSTTPR
ncbi:MAG: dienelactone hydrolase family protein [Alphaproteobacteria bacterium]|nr:dienelactone hydrolase family protein [Alphaproteobacteria bacterium]